MGCPCGSGAGFNGAKVKMPGAPPKRSSTGRHGHVEDLWVYVTRHVVNEWIKERYRLFLINESEILNKGKGEKDIGNNFKLKMI